MFYGCIEHMDQRNWQPHLHRFLDEGPPNAILIEYIPGIEPLSIETATKERMAKFTEGLQAIHDAGIIHFDTYARNMMVDSSKSDKVVWLDFDRARTLDDTRLSDREKELIYDEQACMRAFQSLVVCNPLHAEFSPVLILTLKGGGS
jgi:tRNA A-37 threonylcarbamoyl transferase component Bud32